MVNIKHTKDLIGISTSSLTSSFPIIFPVAKRAKKLTAEKE
jgi:hypothetical protein